MHVNQTFVMSLLQKPLHYCKPDQVVTQEPGADSEPNMFSCTGLLQEIESVTIQWTSLQRYEEYNPMTA